MSNPETSLMNPRREVLVWHDFVHESQELARLYYWRLSFSPSYDRETIFDKLHGVYEKLRINSHIVYETLGDYDLLLRMWVSRNISPEEIDQQIWLDLRDCKLWNVSYLVCRTEAHWSDPTEERTEPEQWPGPYDPVIREVNEFNRRQTKTGEPQARTPGIDRLVDLGVLRSIPTDTRGIRFFITFDHPRSPFTRGGRKQALSSIVNKCKEVGDRWCAGKLDVGDPQISVYEGGGTMSGDFLVMARAPYGYFHKFVGEITAALRDAGLDDLWDMRPYTHVMADEMFSEFTEERPIDTSVAFDFSGDEDESMEFKATFSMNFRTFMATGREEADPVMKDNVAKSLCGLLNSPGGGTLAIGMLEVPRELERFNTRQAKLEYLRKLQDRFDYPGDFAGDDADIPKLSNAVVGVEAEVGEGRLFPDRDKYVGQLTEALRTAIAPNPWPWLTVSFLEDDGKHICLVGARPADLWFYAKLSDGKKHEEFYVREASSTRKLVGTEADEYKIAHPRNGHGKGL